MSSYEENGAERRSSPRVTRAIQALTLLPENRIREPGSADHEEGGASDQEHDKVISERERQQGVGVLMAFPAFALDSCRILLRCG